MNPFLNTLKQKFNSLRLRLYYLFRLKWNLSKPKKRVLIIKNDSIGDYIIFRNFLYEISKSDKFRDYELYLLTTQRLVPIALQLDGSILKEIIIRPDQLVSVDDQIRFYSKLKSYRFDYLLHPTYSPDSRTQYLIKYIFAKSKIGFNGDTSNQTLADKARFEEFYTQLINVRDPFSHEFEKNVDFFTSLLGRSLSLKRPEIIVGRQSEIQKHIVVCPGAQHKIRIWSPEKFGQLITRLNNAFPEHTYTVVTGPGEEDLYSGIEKATSVKLKHFKIDSLLNMASLLSSATLVICNDSSSAHIAVACGVDSICISNGNHYRRFVPYPENMKVNQDVILPPVLLQEMANGGDFHKYYKGSTLDINEIEVDTVFKVCESRLMKN